VDFTTLLANPWTQIGISMGIVALTALLARPVVNVIVNRALGGLAARSQTGLDDALLGALDSPLYWLLVFVSVQFALERLPFVQRDLPVALGDVYFILYLLVGLVVVWRLVGGLTDWYGSEIAPTTETRLDQQMIPFLKRVLLAIVLISVVIILLDHFEIDATGLVATLGIGSLAIALAAQESLSDVISSFMIILDRPFRVGDRIGITELDTWGDVVDIGLRSTRILTQDHRTIIIPNSIIGKNMVVNYSYPNPQYRNFVEVGVAYGVELEKVKGVIVEAVQAVKGVSQSKPVEPLLTAFGDSALVFRVRYWVDSYVDTPRMYDRVNTAIYDALEAAGIPIPFPQRVVHHFFDDEAVRQLNRGRG
jgi:small-conductance mechanosensitive channel